MRVRLRNAVLFLTAIILLGAAGCASVGTEPPTSAFSTTTATAGGAQTLENLQTAFNGESNANAKYLAFAKKADEEGYTKVASLFRAAARSEEIHKTNHAAVIKAMGGNPAADIKPADVKTTAENLKSAVEGETYERDTMYPGFVAEARAAGNTDAVRTFNFAKSAETEHARLYADALANLEKWKGGTMTFFVCPKCGFTSTDPNLEKCPVDFTPKQQFETIS